MLAGQFIKSEVKMPTGAGNPEKKSNLMTVKSRYGEVSVNLDKAIFFPKGLLGLSQFKDFCITDLPSQNMAQFKLLQSLNDSQLSFVVLPITAENGLIDKEDLEECCQVTEIARENLLMLLIITVQQVPGGKSRVTANVRAPIVIDVNDRLAIQYVFPNNKYEIQHVLA